MTNISKDRLEALKQRVVRAFADVPYPKGPIAPHECDECHGVEKDFMNQDWKTIDPSIVEENFGKLPLFSPEAFHFFLPAYLVYALENPAHERGEVAEFTTYALTPGKEIKESPSWWRERFKHFTREQFELVYEYLDLARETEEFDNFVVAIERGKERLKKYIEPTLKK